MSLFQFYLYIAGSLHVSAPQAHPQESSHSCSHNHWFSVCTALAVCSVMYNIQSTRPEQYRHWNSCWVNSCANSPEDGPVGPKHVEIRQYINKIEIVTSVGFYSICWKDARYKKLKFCYSGLFMFFTRSFNVTVRVAPCVRPLLFICTWFAFHLALAVRCCRPLRYGIDEVISS